MTEIAPIVYQNCVTCHRPGESGPFSLITYEDVAGHAQQIAEVVAARTMPPWLPEDGRHKLEGIRRLTEAEINTLVDWSDRGAPSGDLSQCPAPPQFTDGWQLGQPDLTVTMSVPYELAADGPDVYRNFVIPVPTDRPRWVRGMELRPDNRRVVHHAFMLVDRDGECRRLDARDEALGFGGMEAEGAESPDGHFISWQPGKVASFAPAGMAWLLTPGTDLVLQMHLRPSGKREEVQATVGFFFTEDQPVRYPTKLVLRSTDIEIPAGDAHHEIETRYTLSTDVELIGIIPHVHYLGKELEALAILPGGETETLLRIPAWDFNWQGDYRFAQPPQLPAGTTLVQRFVYDNSAANPHNPLSPPRVVRYGLESTDEMCELWFQVLPGSAADLAKLQRDFGVRALQDIASTSREALLDNPRDVKALVNLAKVTLALESPQAAIPIFRQAVEADPSSISANYYLGHALLTAGDLSSALRQLAEVRRMAPEHQMAWHDTGLALMQANELSKAELAFRRSLELNAYHGTTLSNLGLVCLKQGRLDDGLQILQRAQLVRPLDDKLASLIQKARQVQQQTTP